MKPTLSIVIAAYNAERSISRCLDSLNGDCEGRLEVVVVDDGSSDSTQTIVHKYAQSNQSIVLISQENQGADLARACGIGNSHGEFVLCVDADDYMLPEAIPTLLRCIQDYPGVDMIWFQYCTDGSRPIGDDKGISRLSKLGLIEGADLVQIRLNIFQGLSNTLWNKVFRREMLNDKRTVSMARYYGEDFSRVLLALPKVAGCLVIDDVLYCYADDTEGSSSKQLKPIYLQDINAVSRQLLQVAREDGFEGVNAAGTGILAQYYNLFVLARNAQDTAVFYEVATNARETLTAANLPKDFLPSNKKLKLLYPLIMKGDVRGVKFTISAIEFIKSLISRIEGSR
jgi:glycosyltransferase involved in cell wall biosynthesis